MMNDFYKEFEDEFRGSQGAIKERLKAYLPLLDYIKKNGNNHLVIDLGCGRGEWLEILKDSGCHALGIDTDESMLQSAREKKLNVINSDAIEYLRSCESGSVSLITAFHLIEHIKHEDKKLLLMEAYRVLKDTGFVVLETPNPENLIVGTNTFYLDPTHEKPIPPDFLFFMTKFFGFSNTALVRLHSPLVKLSEINSVYDVFRGVSMDYCAVAIKSGEWPRELNFYENKGFGLESVSKAYDQYLNGKIEEAYKRIEAVNQEINAIKESSSWKLTAPLRKIKGKIKSLLGA